MNAFTQQDFKGTYNSASIPKLRSLADNGHADAQELLALGLYDDKQLSTRSPLRLFGKINNYFWAYTEKLYQGWNVYGPHNGI